MTKRRNISLLPVRYQTEPLARFFDVTVDQLFQPGVADNIDGYIGRKPAYYDPAKDFYKIEPTQARTDAQLEAALVSIDTNGDPSRVLFYGDFVNHLRAAGAPVDDIAKMIGSGNYSWCPPIDLDKLVNYQYYYWVEAASAAIPLLSPKVEYRAVAGTVVYLLPAAIPAYVGAIDTVTVSVDGAATTAFTVVGDHIVLTQAAPADAVIVITRYADLIATLRGLEHATLPDGTVLSSGMRVFSAGQTYWVEGVGQSIAFVVDSGDYTGAHPYRVIDRRARDGNPWARRNRWAHRSTITDDAVLIPANQATRPIIEFKENLRLYNYGTDRQDDIDCVMSSDALKAANLDFPARTLTVAEINGMPMGTVSVDGGHVLAAGDRLLARQHVVQWTPRTFFAANAIVGYGDTTYRARIDHVSGNAFSSVNWTIDPLSLVNNRVFSIEAVSDGTSIVYGLLLETNATTDSVVRLAGTETEYWYDGADWNIAQGYSLEPLFALYDAGGTPFDDTTAYPGSNFTGSRLFGYAHGTGTVDAVIAQALSYNEYGQIVFENDLATKTYAADAGPIANQPYYAVTGDFTSLENSWNRNAGPITSSDTAPVNLQANPDNEEPGLISRNQWYDHFLSILSNQAGFTGAPYSTNNWRDTTRDLGIGTSIMQHDAALLRPMLLASDPDFALIEAIRYVADEYTGFKKRFVQRFLDLYNGGGLVLSSDAETWLPIVLASLVSSKDATQAFANSAIGGGQYFIPATPASMGVLPAVEPALYLDQRSDPAVLRLRGHDGSISDTYGDVRDTIMLALETLIYTHIDDGFKNGAIPAFDHDDIISGYMSAGAGRFTTDQANASISASFERWAQVRGLDYRANTGYIADDPFTYNYSSVVDANGRNFDGHWRGIYRYFLDTESPHLTPWEMLGFAAQPDWWVGQYGPAPYTSGNLQMWEDIEAGRIVLGPRAGVSERHIRAGLTDTYSGLSLVRKGFLPVDDSGSLLDPISAGIVPTQPGYLDAIKDWKFGDGADVEALWRADSAFGYARVLLAYLLRPAALLATCWDTLDIMVGPNGQTLSKSTGHRPRFADSVVHGERIDGVLILRTGIQQWIADYMASRGQPTSILGDALRGTQVRLAHKMAGFTTTQNMRISADNFGLVPIDDIKVLLHQSPSIREEFYSGILVEWTGQGYRVIGYDPVNTAFTMFEPETNGPKTKLTTSTNERAVNPWRPSTYYSVAVLVSYQDVVYRCEKSHTSSSIFEQAYWSVDPTAQVGASNDLIRYGRYTNYTRVVPYGTTFTDPQDVVDLLLGYEAYLVSRGWTFERVDTETSLFTDWTAAAKSFAEWAKIGWAPGNFITLSPGARAIDFTTAFGTILNVEQTVGGTYGLIDRAGLPIRRADAVADRLDGTITISSDTTDIFGARVMVAAIEHILVFSNTTIFDSIIYAPLYNLRQPRLKMSAQRAPGWVGRLEAPGFILIDGEIKPSFVKAAEDIREMFDIEKADNQALRDYARHVIGFQTRDYLSSLGMSDLQQFEFYQGMIQNKGAVGSFDKLLRSDMIGRNRDLKFLEEWAVRIGGYGAREPFERWEFEIAAEELRNDPQYVDINPTTVVATNDWLQFTPTDGRWVDYPEHKALGDLRFPVTETVSENALPTAGYVRLSEVTYTGFSTQDFLTLLSDRIDANEPISVGETGWVYDTGGGDWTVLKITNLAAGDSSAVIARVDTPQNDDTVIGTRFVMDAPTGLTDADIGAQIILSEQVETLGPLSGIFTVARLDPAGTWFEIDDQTYSGIDYSTTDEPGPTVLILRPCRFETIIHRDDANGRSNLRPGDLAYCDNDGSGKWAVYAWNNGWTGPVRQQGERIQTDQIASSLLYRLKTQITSSTISPKPLILDHINIVDATCGMIAGAADREIDFKLQYDPAVYANATTRSSQIWGVGEVGRIWWDLSTVRFLDPYTDLLDVDKTSSRYLDEVAYRVANWNRLAPGSSVDIYEWVRSYYAPSQWADQALRDTTGTFSGTPHPLGQFVSSQEYDASTQTTQTLYYFWVANRSVRPSVPFRALSAQGCVDLIANTAQADYPWIAAITPSGMLLGGLTAYFTQPGTIVQIEQKRTSYEGPAHTEWMLMREGDELSQPPAALWRKIRDSLIGFDDMLQAVPDPALHESIAVGSLVRPRQSVFGPRGDVRTGMFDARRSFVEMTNYILARTNFSYANATALEELFTETPLQEYLSWVQSDARSTIEPLPPKSEYDIVVTSVEERDAFLTKRGYSGHLLPYPWDKTGWETGMWDADRSVNPRVLLNGLTESRPQWSVWMVDLSQIADNLTLADLEANIDTYLVPAKTYDYEVDSLAARNALPGLKSGDRVLVRDPASNAFWSIYAYYENTTPKAVAGFTLVNAQTYRTADFLERADWYAPGHSADKPPVIRYANAAERQAREGGTPTSTFVRLDDDGTGHWAWTVYDTSTGLGQWAIVARENGTIQLSETLFDASRPTYGWSDGDWVFDPALVAHRDGSFDLRKLFDLMSDLGILTPADINELFFSMLHFVHSQQDQVDWAFKTSFLSITGYNEPLRAAPVAMPDNIETLLSYLDEVKPYRVKTRDVTRGVSPDVDVAMIRASDFDKPVYYDQDLRMYRRLDKDIARDLAILNSDTYRDWLTNFDTDLVRSIEIELYYDRVWPIAGSDSGAAQIITDAYYPTGDMKEKSLDVLLRLGFKGTILDGRLRADGIDHVRDVIVKGVARSNADIVVNGAGAFKHGFAFDDPDTGAGRPEELAVIAATDSLVIRAEDAWSPGGPQQIVLTTPVLVTTPSVIRFSLGFMPESRAAIAVFRDGIRAKPDNDYHIDQIAGMVAVNVDETVSRITVHAFGHAGTSAIVDQTAFVADGSTKTFAFPGAGGQTMGVEIAGDIEDGSIASVSTDTVTLTNLPAAGTRLVLTGYGSGKRVSMSMTPLAYSSAGTWTLAETDSSNPLEVAGVIVERNGRRLTPPKISYGVFDATNRTLLCEDMPASPTSVDVWIDGVLDTTSTTRSGDIVTANPGVMAKHVAVVMRGEQDYDVHQGVLSIETLTDTDQIAVTTFAHNAGMDLRSVTRNGRSDAIYFVEMPHDQNYAWVTLNGRRMVEHIDYFVEYVVDRFDGYGFDTVRFDAPEPKLKYQFYAPHSASDRIVFTGMLASPALPPRILQIATCLPDALRVVDGAINPDSFEMVVLDAKRRGGTLASRITPESDTITITVGNTLPPEMISQAPFDAPDLDRGIPGKIWIDGERIEYYDYAVSGNTVLLAQIRRGTHGTDASQNHEIGALVYAGTPTALTAI